MSLCKSKRMCTEIGQGRSITDAWGPNPGCTRASLATGFSGGGGQQHVGELLKGRGPGPSTD